MVVLLDTEHGTRGNMHHKIVKSVIGIGLAAVLAGATASTAVAGPLEVLGNGTEAGGTVISDPAGGSRGTTGAGTRRDGGGGSFWQWGVSGGNAWSNYFRESRCHGATAIGKKSKRVTGVPGGRYAYASTPKASSGNLAYYHNC